MGDANKCGSENSRDASREATLFSVLDSVVCLIDLDANGPTGLNLSSVRQALDMLADGVKQGWPITASTARYMQANGWDIGYAPKTKDQRAPDQSDEHG